MSYLFDGVDDNLSIESAVVSDYEITMACWFRPVDFTVGQSLMSVVDKDSTQHYHSLEYRPDLTDDPIRYGVRGGAGGSVGPVTTTGINSSVWTHACAVGLSATSRTVYINGGSKATNTTSTTPTGLDRTTVGSLMMSTPALYSNARIAEAAIWSVALPENDILALASGSSPMFIKPARLISYWPLLNDSNDDKGSNHLTVNGATTDGAHPSIYGAGGATIKPLRKSL